MKKERFITIEIYEMQTGNWNSDSESEYYFEKESAIGNAEYHVYPHLTDMERNRKGEFCIVTGYKVLVPLPKKALLRKCFFNELFVARIETLRFREKRLAALELHFVHY